MLSSADRSVLIDIARSSIRHGLEEGAPLPVRESQYGDDLQRQGACFVTLRIDGRLRGCIGSVEAWRPLVADCADNAFAAAFRDPRFPAVTGSEYARLDYHISVLSPAEPVHFRNEQELLDSIRPGVDGLVLEDKGHRGTFLPSVWEELETPEKFLSHLKLKAGLPTHHWSDTLAVSRYTVEEIHHERTDSA